MQKPSKSDVQFSTFVWPKHSPEGQLSYFHPPGLRGGGHFWKIGQRGGAGQFFSKRGPDPKGEGAIFLGGAGHSEEILSKPTPFFLNFPLRGAFI